MKPRWLAGIVLLLHVPLAFGANREMIELQRDVAQLQQQITTLQTTFDQRLVNMQVLLQQTLDSSNKTNAAMVNVDKTVGDQMRAQSKQVVAPVAALSSKIDTMSGDMQTLTEAVKDLTARMSKIQQQLVDVQTAVRTMAAPAPAPPPAISQGVPAGLSTSTSALPAPPSAASSVGVTGVPPMRAEVLWQSAMRDMKSAKADLAIAEFQDYLKFYGTTDLAPDAQFKIGQIHYTQGNLPLAIQDFDAVIERYPVNSLTPDAYFMKGKSLVQSGQRDKGVKEFQALVDKFPRSDLAASAKGQLKALGLTAPARPVRRR